MYTKSIKSTVVNVDKAIAVFVGTLSIICMVCMAVINQYYPYNPIDDTLVKKPQYIRELIDILDCFTLLGLPFLLLLVLLNTGFGLSKKFTLNSLLLNVAALLIVIAALLYCSTLFLEGFN